jgi:hypothetical protein
MRSRALALLAAPSPDYLSPQPEQMVFLKANQAVLVGLTIFGQTVDAQAPSWAIPT